MSLTPSSSILITNGASVQNLHLDIFHLPDPTLAFLGISVNTATFSFFEYQAIAIARVFAGHAELPVEEVRRKEYEKRVEKSGSGKFLNFIGREGDPIYVDELVKWLNKDAEGSDLEVLVGRTREWKAINDQTLAKLAERNGVPLEEVKAAVKAVADPKPVLAVKGLAVADVEVPVPSLVASIPA